MNPKNELNILDALENLNALVDAETLDEIEVTEEARFIPHKGIIEEEEGYWVRASTDEQTVHAIKVTFRSVYDYLQVFYQKMRQTGDTKKLVEGVNTIMVLVGEAAKKLDRFGTLFRQKVSDFPEYKQLQNFYKRKVIPESFQEFAKTPIAEEKGGVLPEQEEWEKELQELLQEEEKVEEVAGVHILNDIDVIKRDHLYELFYLKNEAGHHFFSLGLARNIKLACDFGVYSEEYFGDDPLLQIKNWEDKQRHVQAIKILKSVRLPLEKFYSEALKYKEMEAVMLLHNACMALMLAANPRNLIRQFSLKGCHVYFSDFLLFLREVLHNREYEKLMIYGPPSGKPFFQGFLNLVQRFCNSLFIETQDFQEIADSIRHLVNRQKHKEEGKLSEILSQANQALIEAFKKHPNGPVFKALDIVREEEEERVFDPFLQGNLPSFEWSLERRGKKMHMLRMPCPVVQEWINDAVIIEEFKTFLSRDESHQHFLFVNFQDRTSWKEHARSVAIEELSRQAEFAEVLTVVTLAKDTDFYNQSGNYSRLDEAGEFIGQFKDHLSDESTGFYFPPQIKKLLFPDFVDRLLDQIHKTFFDSKKTLTFLERLDFIGLAYHFIELKLIELVKPNYLTLSSKDGLDIGGTSSIGLMALLTLAKGEPLNSEKVRTLLFGPTILMRERVIHPERFDRLFALVQLLENKADYLKPFEGLFAQETLAMTVSLD